MGDGPTPPLPPSRPPAVEVSSEKPGRQGRRSGGAGIQASPGEDGAGRGGGGACPRYLTRFPATPPAHPLSALFPSASSRQASGLGLQLRSRPRTRGTLLGNIILPLECRRLSVTPPWAQGPSDKLLNFSVPYFSICKIGTQVGTNP